MSAVELRRIVDDSVPVERWPEPLPLKRECVEREPYPVDALPATIRDAVRDVQAATQAPLALIAGSAIAAASLASQHVADVERDNGLRGPASLYLMTIAESGERKSAVDALFRRPLDQWETQRRAELADDDRRSRAALAAWAEARDGIKAAIKLAARRGSDVSDLTARLQAHEARQPPQIRMPRLFFADASIEKLVERMAATDGWPSGASWSAEGGTVTGGFAFGDESRVRSVATLNALWSGEPLYVDRIGRGSVRAIGQRLTLNWSLQPAIFADFSKGGHGIARGSGLLARCLIAEPESRMGARLFRPVPAELPGLARFGTTMRSLLSHRLPLDPAAGLVPPVVTLSGDARAAWVTLHDHLERALAPGSEFRAVADWTAKGAEQAARLAAVFELAECGTVPANISEHSMAAAGSLVLWHAREAARILGSRDCRDSDAEALEAFLVARRGAVSRRDVQNSATRALRNGGQLNTAIRALEAAGRARVRVAGQSEVIELNPALLGQMQ